MLILVLDLSAIFSTIPKVGRKKSDSWAMKLNKFLSTTAMKLIFVLMYRY